jgi:hypothetical protein
MGAAQAHEFAALADLVTALTWHLRCNHYPPLPVEMVPVCAATIDHLNQGGDWEDLVDLPDGVTFRDQPVVPAFIVVDTFHLDAWIRYWDN